MSRPAEERNQDASVYIGNLDERVTDALVWELMLQAGPVENVHLPKDRVSMSHQGYGFCEFMSEEDADYACQVMNQVKLFGRPIRLNKASNDRKVHDIGANLFVGSLDPLVDERVLFDTFSAFGTFAIPPRVARDPETGASKGYGFVNYDSFEASDAALEAMNNQHLMNQPITVAYAFKKDGKGERHGTAAERLLAAEGKKHNPAVAAAAAAAAQQPPQLQGLPQQAFPQYAQYPQGAQYAQYPQQGAAAAYPPPPGFAPGFAPGFPPGFAPGYDALPPPPPPPAPYGFAQQGYARGV